jgi:F-type H+-transporting ATPase subunit epsilon
MPPRLEVVTPERIVLEDEVDIVIARGVEGDIGVLHGHERLVTPLATGELTYRSNGEEHFLAISGGFLEITPEKVIVLADVAERSDEIDRERAEAARLRAEEQLTEHRGTELEAAAAAALQQALLRLRVAGRRRHERPGPGPGAGTEG